MAVAAVHLPVVPPVTAQCEDAGQAERQQIETGYRRRPQPRVAVDEKKAGSSVEGRQRPEMLEQLTQMAVRDLHFPVVPPVIDRCEEAGGYSYEYLV